MTGPVALTAPVILCGQDLAEPQSVGLHSGQAAVFSRPHGGQCGVNEDALGVVEGADGQICLAVADGVGVGVVAWCVVVGVGVCVGVVIV